jgi:hypothetical protein
MREVKAWVRRQENANYAREVKAKQTASALRSARNSPLFLSRQWRPNETLDMRDPIRVPSIGLTFSEAQVRSVIDAIEGDAADADAQGGEVDIELAHEWDIFSLLVCERPPVIARIDEAEERYKSALRDVKLSQPMPDLFRTLFVDRIKKSDAEFAKNTQIRPRITSEDLADEAHSLNRGLDRRLYLISKLKNRADNAWEFPWARRRADETLFETAMRALGDRAGSRLQTTVVSHAPFGHIEKAYPEAMQAQSGKRGAQVFFQRVYYVSGNARIDDDNDSVVEDFAWVPKEDLVSRINPELFDSINPLLLD